MTIVTGIVKSTWEKEMKMVGYFNVNGEQLELNQEDTAIVKERTAEATKRGEKVEQRRVWLDENLNLIHHA